MRHCRLLFGLWLVSLAPCLAHAADAIVGSVQDAKGSPLNGVFVSATRNGANYTVTVFSDDAGKFRFGDNLAAGTYTVTAHASGFQSIQRSNVDVKPQTPLRLDFSLQEETRLEEQFKQATPGEWLASVPGTEEEKRSVARHCSGCHHNLYQVMAHRFDKDGWMKIVAAMELVDAIGIPRSVPGAGASGLPQQVISPGKWHFASREEIADYLAKIRGPESPYPKIKFNPRASGKATQAVITEYLLPRENAIPHDVVLDPQGNAWYNDFKADYLGKINAKTGEITEYKLPTAPPPSHPGSADMFYGQDGQVWVSERLAQRTVRFDPKTATVTAIYPKVSVDRVDPQRNVALGTHMRLDLKTGDVFRYKYKANSDGYGTAVDARGFGYRGGIKESDVKVLNPETGEVKSYLTPTPESGPRRICLDWDENVWFGEWLGGKIGKLEVKSGKITEFPVSLPYAAFYEACADVKNHNGWGFDWHNDRLLRVNGKTGEITQYPMPTPDVESRRTAFDPSTDPPTVWIHGAGNGRIIRVQAP